MAIKNGICVIELSNNEENQLFQLFDEKGGVEAIKFLEKFYKNKHYMFCQEPALAEYENYIEGDNWEIILSKKFDLLINPKTKEYCLFTNSII